MRFFSEISNHMTSVYLMASCTDGRIYLVLELRNHLTFVTDFAV
jgi:hypothetical protein